MVAKYAVRQVVGRLLDVHGVARLGEQRAGHVQPLGCAARQEELFRWHVHAVGRLIRQEAGQGLEKRPEALHGAVLERRDGLAAQHELGGAAHVREGVQRL